MIPVMVQFSSSCICLIIYALCLYRKLAKSTLVLIPLFGVYYILVILIPDTVNPKVYLIRFYTETILNSFQVCPLSVSV